MDVSVTLYVLNLIGGVVFAVSGALAAGRKKLDWVGVIVLAFVTSVGGGTIRDVLLNRESVFWIKDHWYLWVTVFAAIGTIIYVRFFKPPHKSLLVADALGLALFTIVGAQIAEEHNVAPVIVVVMAVLTGTAGGVLRDVFTGEIPIIFRSSETLYSVASLAGVSLYLGLQYIGLDKTVAALAGVICVASLRFAAIFWHIRLPAFHIRNQ